MSIITTALELANLALSKLGGAGDQVNGKGTLNNLLGTDGTTTWVNLMLPQARQRAIRDLARTGLPFKEAFKYADLGDDLKDDDVSIATVTGDGAAVTVVTSDVHGRTTADTVFLSGLDGDADMVALNGTTVAITVVDTTTFTFAGTATGTHTANTGTVSTCPEIGKWMYAFTLPSDCLEVVGQYNEILVFGKKDLNTDHPFGTILNADGDGFLFLTNNLSNEDGDSAYIGYATDSTAYSIWTSQLVESVATLLAVMLCPVVARDIETQKKLELYYRYEVIPYAKRCNAAMSSDKVFNNIDYTGGRSIGVSVRSARNLGTYVDAEGNRRDVY